MEDFNAVYTINTDASVSAVETILYDFGGNEKHGIYRKIPVDYKTDNGTRTIEIDGMEITDDFGASYKFTQSIVGAYLELKIGDANAHVSVKKHMS